MTSIAEEKIKAASNKGIDAVENTTFDVLEQGREAAMKAAEAIGVTEEEASKAIESTTKKVTQFINDKPLQAAGIAFAAGVVATLLLSRR